MQSSTLLQLHTGGEQAAHRLPRAQRMQGCEAIDFHHLRWKFMFMIVEGLGFVHVDHGRTSENNGMDLGGATG